MSDLRTVFFDLEASAVDGSDSESGDDVNFNDQGFIEDGPVTGEVDLNQSLARENEEREDERHWEGVIECARARASGDDLPDIDASSGSIDSEQYAIELNAERIEAWPFLQEDVLKGLNPVLQERILENLGSLKSGERWPWAKVRGSPKKWSRYAGDTGLITKVEGDHNWYLALIPRVGELDHSDDDQSRPPQALASRRSLDVRKAPKVGPSGTFYSKGTMYSAEGCILVELAKIKVLPLLEPLPTSIELKLFQSTTLLSTAVSEMTEQQIAQSRIKIGDRLKVLSGPYIHSRGEVKEVNERTVTVYLPVQDSVEEMALDTVRAAFTLGDKVRAVDGKSKGLVGWVIGVIEGDLCVLNVEAGKEFRVSRADAEFYDEPQSFVNEPQTQSPLTLRGKLGGKNPNDIHISKRVVVVGVHELKGYRGIIRSTTPDGYAFLQLDTQFQQSVKVALVDLACLTHEDRISHKLVSGMSFGDVPMPLSTLEQASSSTCMVGKTLTWEPSDSPSASTHLSPAWDPSSRTPLLSRSASPVPPRPVHWLDNPLVWSWRIKLKPNDSSSASPYVEFLGVENDLVKVRDKADIKLLPFELVTPLPPTSGGDLVVPKTGELKGVQLRVLRVEGDTCMLRKVGVCTPTRKNPDRQFAVSDIVQVFPALRKR